MLLEWTAALELFARKQVKAIMPIIACDDDGSEFSWVLPSTLCDSEHGPTLTATKKHLNDHPSSNNIANSLHVLDGARGIIADVKAEDESAGQAVSVAGVVSALLRFQGIILTDRDDLAPCTDRIFSKVSSILNRGTMDGNDGDDVAVEQNPLTLTMSME